MSKTDEQPEVSFGWFSLSGEYAGDGRAVFEKAGVAAEGPVHIRFAENSGVEAHLQIDRLSTGDPTPLPGPFAIMQAFSGATPEIDGRSRTLSIGIDTPGNRCKLLRVECTDGRFTGVDNSYINYGFSMGGEPKPPALELEFSKSQFDADNAADPIYWVMPLQNYVTDFSVSATPLPDGFLRVDSANQRLIVFEVDDAPALIEPLPDYTNRRDLLVSGSESTFVTAVMIGQVNLDQVDELGLLDALPIDLLSVLSLVTGVEVGCPWIELRDSAGGLVQRTHIQLGRPLYRSGRALIDESLFRSTGQLLTQAVHSAYFETNLIRVASSHLVRSGYADLSLDDALSYVIRALDGLVRGLGFYSPEDLTEAVDGETISELMEIIAAAEQAIGELIQHKRRTNEHFPSDALESIQGRVKDAPNIRSGFHRAVSALLERFGLPDAEVTAEYYALRARPRNRRTWERDIAAYRGMVFHDGYIDFSNPNNSAAEAHAICIHLRDILSRILLKLIDYDGVYQPPVWKMATTGMSLDWVTLETPASRLGYQ